MEKLAALFLFWIGGSLILSSIIVVFWGLGVLLLHDISNGLWGIPLLIIAFPLWFGGKWLWVKGMGLWEGF